MAVTERQSALDAIAAAVGAAAAASTRHEALGLLARAAAEACAAEVAIVRAREGDALVARAVHSASPVAAAVAESSSVLLSALDDELHVPARAGDELLGSLELQRVLPLDAEEHALARIVAVHIALVLRSFQWESRAEEHDAALVLAGEALAAVTDDEHAAEQVARLAAAAARAEVALVWSQDGRLAASIGSPDVDEGILATAALRMLGSLEFLAVEDVDGRTLASVRLGEPAAGVLQLVLPAGEGAALAGLGTFALRAAEALRASQEFRATERELEQTRALLSVMAKATARLSLGHTLATAVGQLAALTRTDRVAVYLREEGRLVAAAGRSLAGPHTVVAEALLAILSGPYRGRGIVAVEEVAREPRLAGVEEAASESGIESAVALPLVVRDETIGLLALFPPAGRPLGASERSLLSALAAQLAVAVQNARLHEHAKQLAEELTASLDAERDAARRVRALYEVSRSFAQSLSLAATLDALAQNAVELLGVDAAAIRIPDARGELLTTRSMYVADVHLEEAARTVLARPQPFGSSPLQKLFRRRRPLQLNARIAAELGGAHDLLVPFLERGSTAAILPIATPAEVIATLTIVSFDPGRPIGGETLETGLSIAAQAALAIDNGRLYQQQKEFADTMQRSLLPRTHPKLPGLEIGEVYESSARVDVGGDVYDFLDLGDGRLAVVLGDVTGHGIEATADMAMAKFVFRSLSREHPDPGDFLSAANEVVVGEIGAGKFITMAYVTVDAPSGQVVAACAGHPPPLLLGADGGVTTLEARGLALGVDAPQEYEEVRTSLERGGAIVLFTDGVIEARRDGELYGAERLSRVVASSHELAAGELARAIVEDCRRFAGGDLADDCAVIVVRRT